MNLIDANRQIEELKNKAVVENKNGNYEEAIALLKQAGQICIAIAKAVPSEKEYNIKRLESFKKIMESIRAKQASQAAKPQTQSQPKPQQGGKPGEKPKQGEGEEGLHYTTSTGISFDDVVGMEKAKQIIRTDCIGYFKNIEIAKKLNYKPANALLLYGVPGTGKTFFAKAVATEVGAPFFHIAAKDIKDKYVGESEKNITKIFDQLKQHDFAIVFLDEAEEVLKTRGSEGSTHTDSLVVNFLKVIDGFDSGQNFLFIAATNCPADIDPAILSRCRYKINVALPNLETRHQILKKQFGKTPLAQDVDLLSVAKRTEKFSSRDLSNLTQEVIGQVFLKYLQSGQEINEDEIVVAQADIEKVLKGKRPSLTQAAVDMIAKYERDLNPEEMIKDEEEVLPSLGNVDLDEPVIPELPKPEPKPVSKPAAQPKAKPKPTPPPVDNGEVHFNLEPYEGYEFPSTTLLNEYQAPEYNEVLIQAMGVKIREKLQEFQINVRIVEYTVAPQVIRFDVKLPGGMSITKITGLTSEISRALNGSPVNIRETIQGKDLFGIEVANPNKAMVGLRKIVESDEFKELDTNSLSAIIGIDTENKVVIAKNGSICHTLVSGSTGSGKSVFMNSLICSFLYKYTPNDLRLMLIDPKRVEFSIYKKIPHLLCPVISDINNISMYLDALINLMEERYSILEDNFYKDLTSYNRDHPDKKMPLICVVIDEFADIVVSAKDDDFINKLISLSSKGRAAGIHIILATQRPSADIIGGPIKTNFVTRVAFKVPSNVDSRVILNESGAETLCGKGDLIFKGLETTLRAQGAYVTDDEIRKIMLAICK